MWYGKNKMCARVFGFILHSLEFCFTRRVLCDYVCYYQGCFNWGLLIICLHDPLYTDFGQAC